MIPERVEKQAKDVVGCLLWCAMFVLGPVALIGLYYIDTFPTTAVTLLIAAGLVAFLILWHHTVGQWK